MRGIPVEPTETTLTDDRFVPARTLPLFLAFLAVGTIVLAFTLRTVNARSIQELQTHARSRRAHVGITYWTQHGYFSSAGLPVRETIHGQRYLYFYRSSSGAYMLSGLLVQKVYGAFTGRYGWQAVAVHHQLISLVTSALLALLAFRIATRLGLGPLHAFIVAAVTETVFFTFPGNLFTYWEMSEMLWCLLFGLLFLLLEEKEPTRRVTLIRAALIFLLTYFSVTTGVFFVAAYAAATLVLRGRIDGYKRFVATLIVPAAVAVAIYGAQLAWVSWKYPKTPLMGSSILFRSGFDGSRAEYKDHADLLVGRQPGARAGQETEVRRPWLFGAGLLSVLALFVAYTRGRIGMFPLLVIVTIAGTYLLYAGIFSQAVVIHPHLYDPILALPLILAIFTALPALLETLTRRTGSFVVIALFAGYMHATANVREYAVGQPLPGAAPIVTGREARRAAIAAPAAGGGFSGTWKSVPHAPANFTANVGAWTVDAADQAVYSYTYLGEKTMMVSFFIQSTDVTATPKTRALQIAIPEGKRAARATGTMCRVRDGSGELSGGFVAVQPGGEVIAVQKIDAKPWTTTAKDDTLVFGSITFEIR